MYCVKVTHSHTLYDSWLYKAEVWGFALFPPSKLAMNSPGVAAVLLDNPRPGCVGTDAVGGK